MQDILTAMSIKMQGSKSFPQENQAHLETKKYFNSQNQKRVNKFLKYLKEEHNIEEIEEENKPKVIEIKEQKKKYNLPSSNGSKQNVQSFSKKDYFNKKNNELVILIKKENELIIRNQSIFIGSLKKIYR